MTKRPQSPNYVRIFDTTLRDGEQSPGATLTSTEKLEVAHALGRLGIDVIEAGFPAASPDDLAAVQQIAQSVGNAKRDAGVSSDPPIICGLARAAKKDIDKAWQAVSPAKHPRIHTFLATSPIHREHKLRMDKKEVLKRIGEMVKYARSLCKDIEFSPEDAGRTEPDFLYEAIGRAITAGASTINIPDTVGYTVPEEFGALIAGIKANVPGIDQVIISVHCHNDLGLATANTLAGIRAGARQAEVTINGIGERAGNTSLEEVVMALRTREKVYGLQTGIETTRLTRTSKLVSTSTGLVVQPNKAIVGANAFAHEAGIHQDGMLKHQTTYEIMRPETVGATQTRLVLGKHSGRHAFGVRLKELGYSLEGDQLQRAFEQFKALADQKKNVTDADLQALATTEFFHPVAHFTLERLQVSSSNLGIPTATIQLKDSEGKTHTVASIGSGPIDAIYKAIDEIVKTPSELLEYSVHAVTEGIDALGEVSVRIRGNQPQLRNPQHDKSHRIYYGHGASTDVLVASAKAYVSALNRLISDLQPARLPAPVSQSRAQSQQHAETKKKRKSAL